MRKLLFGFSNFGFSFSYVDLNFERKEASIVLVDGISQCHKAKINAQEERNARCVIYVLTPY